MGIRTVFYRVLFFSTLPLSGFAAVIQTNQPSPVGTKIPSVIVTAKRHNFYSSTSAPKTIITQHDITTTGVTSLSQALTELGGVQLEDTSGNGSQVMLSMRGFGVNASSNTLLLINGIPLSNPDLAPPDLNAIPLQEIEYIEIINGSESVLYGDQAVGGIVNIITHQEAAKKLDITCNSGSYNAHSCYASLHNHTQQLNYNFGVMNNHSDNYRQNNNLDQTLLSGMAKHTYQTGNIRFDYKIINERMQYPGALTAQQVRQNRRQSANTTDFFKDWNGLFNLKNQQKLTENWQLNTDFSRREMHGSGVLTSPFQQSRYINFLRPVLKGKIRNVTLTNGIDVAADNYYLNTLFGVNSDSLQKYGLFILGEMPATSRLAFSAGVRGAQQNNHLVTHSETINRALATTIGATYQLTDATKIYARRAENFRFPNADENAFAPTGVNGLKTQRGVSYETGAQWDWKNLYSKLGLYILNLTNEITYDPTQTPQQPFGSDSNLDPTKRYGLSLVEKYKITDRLTADAQYNYVNARFQNGIYSGKRIPLVSENILHAGMNYGFTQHWNLYTEGVYTGNQYAANDNANVAGTMGGYTVVNMNLRFEYQQFSASFRVNNIFNRYYYFYTVFTPGINTESFYPAPGRNLMLTMKYVFL
jgi:iron complex outermembrane receptor protein